MKIEVIGCSGGESPGRRLTCLLIDDRIALDAGSLTQGLEPERQARIDALVLTHSHLDHTNAIPFFIENVYGLRRAAIGLHASKATIYALRRNLFNDASWPDFTRLPNHLLPAIKFHEIESGVPFNLGGVRFTPIAVDHLVPTLGFLIEQGNSAVLWSSDTGPTERLWEIANRTPNLKALCIEVSFDNGMQPIADVSMHLTPRTLGVELGKLERNVPILLHHVKPQCAARIESEVGAWGRGDIGFLEQGRVYEF
jgi:ribonuclease BN (tRNA processing enzyme)